MAKKGIPRVARRKICLVGRSALPVPYRLSGCPCRPPHTKGWLSDGYRTPSPVCERASRFTGAVSLLISALFSHRWRGRPSINTSPVSRSPVVYRQVSRLTGAVGLLISALLSQMAGTTFDRYVPCHVLKRPSAHEIGAMLYRSRSPVHRHYPAPHRRPRTVRLCIHHISHVPPREPYHPPASRNALLERRGRPRHLELIQTSPRLNSPRRSHSGPPGPSSVGLNGKPFPTAHDGSNDRPYVFYESAPSPAILYPVSPRYPPHFHAAAVAAASVAARARMAPSPNATPTAPSHFQITTHTRTR